MCEFLTLTLTRPELFWPALEAIATVAAVGFLLFELDGIRRDAASRKVEGLKYAIEQLHAADFEDWMRLIETTWKEGGDEYAVGVHPYVVSALGRVDHIAKLAKLRYIDEKVLFDAFGHDLSNLEAFIRNFERKKGSQVPGARASYHDGYRLLKRAAAAYSRQTKEAVARLKKDQPKEDVHILEEAPGPPNPR